MNNQRMAIGVGKVLKYLAVIGVLSLVSCASPTNYANLYPIKKGEAIVLQQACYFIENPGVDDLIPEGSRYLNDYRQNSKGIVPKGTQVKFLGIYAENGFMSDTHLRSYGRILEGKFRGRKVDIDYVMELQCQGDLDARRKIEMEIFSNK